MAESALNRSSRSPSGAERGRTTGVEMRHALRRYVTGVTVVTTIDECGGLVGLTANSFTSVSLDPPLISVCLNLKSRSYEHCVRHGRFTVNALTDEQKEVAEQFAVRGGARDDVCPWYLNARGHPVLSESLAHFDCALVDRMTAGDHAILVGEVEAVSLADNSRPLVFHDGKLFGLGCGLIPE